MCIVKCNKTLQCASQKSRVYMLTYKCWWTCLPICVNICKHDTDGSPFHPLKHKSHHSTLIYSSTIARCFILHLTGLFFHSPSWWLSSFKRVASHDTCCTALSLWSSIICCLEIVRSKALRSAHYAEACSGIVPSVWGAHAHWTDYGRCVAQVAASAPANGPAGA
jgi:hypothetical protein